jgi:thiol-disulfide isomerase/thioredoxin
MGEFVMAAAKSRMLELGTPAPAFALPDPDGAVHELRDGADAYLVMFICNHCPYVKHVRGELARIGDEYGRRNVAIYAINSNDVTTHPGDSPAKMKQEAENWGYTFPYLYDAGQDVAKSYLAACTPDFFVFDSERKLVYRGQLDDSRPTNNIPVDGCDLRAALEAVLNDTPVAETQKPSVGCSIKWQPGNEPDYA